jgi:phospholipid/cholesterol/gamma-HCH transport system ATP-binding protein
MAVPPMLEIVDLWKSFGTRQILRGLSLSVFTGEMLGLIGPSGCGKTTTLKLICDLLSPERGQIVKRSEEIGLVFQGSALLNSLTVRENLALALRRRKLKRNEENAIIEKKLKLVGLAEYIDAYPTQLSGGQQKRTSFARAIVNDPKIILYDEPTTGLDPVMSTIIEDYMIELKHQLNAAAIVVTHQYSTWSRCSERVLLMHEGKSVWEGTPEEAIQTNDPYMRQFAHGEKEGPMLSNLL